MLNYQRVKSCSIIQTHVFLCIAPAQSQFVLLKVLKKGESSHCGILRVVIESPLLIVKNHLFVSSNPHVSWCFIMCHPKKMVNSSPFFWVKSHLSPQVPSILAEATVLWQLGDHWSSGPKREVAMRQTHTVQLVQPRLGDIYSEGSLWLPMNTTLC